MKGPPSLGGTSFRASSETVYLITRPTSDSGARNDRDLLPISRWLRLEQLSDSGHKLNALGLCENFLGSFWTVKDLAEVQVKNGPDAQLLLSPSAMSALVTLNKTR